MRVLLVLRSLGGVLGVSRVRGVVRFVGFFRAVVVGSWLASRWCRGSLGLVRSRRGRWFGKLFWSC